MVRSPFVPAVLAATLVLASAGAVFASSESRRDDSVNEASAVLNASTTLSQAIAAAERETGGKAIDAGVEHEHGVIAYEVKVVSGDTIRKVMVAMDTGKVVKVKAVERDDDEDGDGD